MVKIVAIIATSLICISGDPIDRALQMIGLTKETAQIDLGELNFMYNSQYQLAYYNMLMKNTYKIPDYCMALGNELFQKRFSMSEMLISSSQLIDVGISSSMMVGQVMEYKNRLQEKK